jgi:outer membrane lipoprotein carrier protein
MSAFKDNIFFASFLFPLRLCAIFVSFSAIASAATPETDALQRFVDKVESLSATFDQVQKDENGHVLQVSTGRLWLQRPAKFHWRYEKPYEQLVVCDGKQLWQYDPDLKQALVRPAGGTLEGTPAQLLTDRASLEKHFKVEPAGTEEGAQKLRLLPKATDGDFKSVELWLKDGVPSRMRFHDPLGGVSEVTFGDVKTNVPLEARLFRFEPPKGVEVISAQ